MYEIDKYINYIKNKIDKSNETKLIMQVYIDLGLRLTFDEDFFFIETTQHKQSHFAPHTISYLSNFFTSL